ncbi:energy transducer TonB [Undibacterium oligocarboniphilum]|uniref:TonB C-terminal domain-containing protein n=1 Tax=Undibacterium oligocarboniphilum TaxID=666702 RepID=A0A850QRM7_9BURK|nr:hypothetical protein [Undibacterium oligocarboniphilum]MBC3870493.1 hypothetical protein [Undibacterium oligocarboniphilum]NVO78706.1 hypothetical protein [Undibacterium oligocarboniphilum]
MNARLLKFLLCSLALHLTCLWIFWRGDFAPYGTVKTLPGKVTAPSGLTIRIVASSKNQNPAIPVPSKEEVPAETHDSSVNIKNSNEQAKLQTENVLSENYFPAGSLTRLPEPVTDIDLNIPAIDEVAVAGKTELTLLIDSDGTVVNVLESGENEDEWAFSRLIAQHFRNARFIPGEINGKAVKSALKITVISEPRLKQGD